MVLQQPPQSHLKILVVEDHDLLRRLFQKTFPDDYTVHTASSVKEGWKSYQDCTPDIIFLDINLPDGNGHSLAGKIRQRNPAAFIVMITSSHDIEDIEEAERNHVAGFIIKPFDKATIYSYIERYLTTYRPSIPA